MTAAPRPVPLGELATLVGADAVTDDGFLVRGFRALGDAGPDDLSFVTQGRYLEAARQSRAGALIVGRDLDREGLAARVLVVDDPQEAMALALERLYPARRPPAGVHPTAIVADDCRLGSNVSVGPYCIVGSGCSLGDEVVLAAHVTVGNDCSIGAGSTLHPRVVLCDGVELGQRCSVHPGAVIGSDGFGYASATGLPTKVRQVGRVVIGDDVEVGANSTIDRATLEETRIGRGTKIDNLVQIGHNVSVGEGCLLCGQAGIAGSAHLGDGVVLAGQAGVSGHLTIGNGVQVAAKSAVLQSVADGQVVGGIPAMPIRDWQRQAAALRRLAELRRRVAALERVLRAGVAADDRGP